MKRRNADWESAGTQESAGECESAGGCGRVEGWLETAKTEFSGAKQRAVVSPGVASSFVALRARGWWRCLRLEGTGGVDTLNFP